MRPVPGVPLGGTVDRAVAAAVRFAVAVVRGVASTATLGAAGALAAAGTVATLVRAGGTLVVVVSEGLPQAHKSRSAHSQ
jgi:hypothetical protein